MLKRLIENDNRGFMIVVALLLMTPLVVLLFYGMYTTMGLMWTLYIVGTVVAVFLFAAGLIILLEG